MPKLPRAAAVLTAAAFACLFLLATVDTHADDKKSSGKKDRSKVATKDAKHLAYKKTYADALLEARIRNLPVFVSRHKDF